MSVIRLRKWLAGELAKELPKNKYVVFPSIGNRDTIGKPTLLISRAAFEPLRDAPITFRANEFELLVISNIVTGDSADDIMEDLADEVVDALMRIPGALVQRAERRVYDDSNPAYLITVILPDDRTPTTKE